MSDPDYEYTIFQIHPTKDPSKTVEYEISNIVLDGFKELFPTIDVRDILQDITDEDYEDELEKGSDTDN